MDKDLQNILSKRLEIAQNEKLPISTRKAEDQITRTILAIARLLIDDNKEEQIDNKIETEKKTEKTTQNKTNSVETESKAFCSKNACSDNPYASWLIANFDKYESIAKLTEAFNEHFRLKISAGTVNHECIHLGLKIYTSTVYTKEEDRWLIENINKMPIDELVKSFQKKFKKCVTTYAIRSHCYRLCLPTTLKRRCTSIFTDDESIDYSLFQQNDATVKPNMQCCASVKTQSKPRLPWNDKHKQWLIDNFDKYTTMVALTEAFNKHFSVNVCRQLITEKCKLYGLAEHSSINYTVKEDNWLRLHVNDALPFESLNDLFKVHFGKDVSTSALKSHCRNLGLLDRHYCKMPSTSNVACNDALVSAAEKIITAAEKISDAADRITAQRSNNCNVFIQ